MEFDFATLDVQDRYKLLCSVVVPRPIALVTTRSPEGVVNAAPFSFFNAMSYEPPVVVLGIDDLVPGQVKDTVRNVRMGSEFVVNMVTEELAESMRVCAVNFPPERDELAEAGLTAAPAARVTPPRVAESPVSLECRELFTLELGPTRHILLGKVVYLHVADRLFDDAGRLHVDPHRLNPVGRLFGPWYCRLGERFELPGMNYEQWRASHDPDGEG